ncbi:MAG: hypothetical protein SAK29_29480 [Scytonema sp. PMC 1069.18]|nr:hypothetical protein [Scytonema sp. PMC 1069.18]MEC4886046.1 hypothetical protein [Scytonema sp. PMC 1070.18]
MTKYKGKAVKGKRGFASEGKGVGAEGKSYGAKFPNYIARVLENVPNRSDFIRYAVMTFLDLNSRSLEILNSTNNHSRVINEALALIEENNLLDELIARVSFNSDDQRNSDRPNI